MFFSRYWKALLDRRIGPYIRRGPPTPSEPPQRIVATHHALRPAFHRPHRNAVFAPKKNVARLLLIHIRRIARWRPDPTTFIEFTKPIFRSSQ